MLVGWLLAIASEKPRLLLYALFALLPTQMLFVPVTDFFVSLTDVLVCAAGGILLLRLLEGRPASWQALHQHRHLLLMLGSYVAGFLVTGTFSRTLIRFPMAVMLSILACELLRTRAHLQRAATAVVVAGALDTAYGLYFIARGTPLYPTRFSGMSEVNFSAMLILTAACIALAQRAGARTSGKLLRPGALAAAGFATLSQMGFVAVLVGWFSVLRRVLSRGLRARIAVAGLLVVVAALAVGPFRGWIASRNARQLDPDGVSRGTAELRMELLRIAWTGFRGSPIVGVGYGRFPELSRSDPRIGWRLGPATHNTYVEVLVEGGLITFSFFILHWLQYFPGFFVAIRVAADRRDSVIAASVVGLPIVLVCAALANVLVPVQFLGSLRADSGGPERRQKRAVAQFRRDADSDRRPGPAGLGVRVTHCIPSGRATL